MLKDFAWKTFENTGSIDSYILYKEIDEKRKTFSNIRIVEVEKETAAGVS